MLTLRFLRIVAHMIGLGVLDFYLPCDYPSFQANQHLGKIGQPTHWASKDKDLARCRVGSGSERYIKLLIAKLSTASHLSPQKSLQNGI